MIAYNIRTLPETILFDCNSKDPITRMLPLTRKWYLQTIYPGRMRAIEDAVNELKQNNPRGGIEPNALARNEVMIAALISKTLLYNMECFATTNCSKASTTPRIKAIGVSIHLAPKANAVVNNIQSRTLRPTQTEARPYIKTTTHSRYRGGFFTISSRSLAASSTPITSWMTP